ncbi:MAG: hypothetical protein LBD43_03345 [Holosporales bacterium]|jgi:hypothetical protein|nr:hypothetical protein [Holosporales bacterium]
MSSIGNIKSNEVSKEFYRKLRDEGNPGKVAVVAVAKKLPTIPNAKMKHLYDGAEIY